MVAFLKILGTIVQVVIAIPKIADVFEKIIAYINKEIEKKRRKERDKEIKKAVEVAITNNDASGLEGLLNRNGVYTAPSKNVQPKP